ncbi:MAG: carboxypeptidase regulatory-like domain-containing protein [Sandaracinaceae bacterium]|nr:carboxypeptidase regulatory-like domain-containing protein [Sandaracinaceae bacterium]
MRRAILLPLVGLFALSAGCESITGGPPSNHCVSDDECVAARCDTALGMCVTESRRPMRLALEVRPMTEPYGGSVQAIPFAPFALDGAGPQELELEPGVLVQGLVRGGGAPIAAELTFSRQSPIPGRAPSTITVEASGATPVRLEAGREAAFLTQLLPGRHELTVSPTGEWRALFPPLYRAYETPAEGNGFLPLDYPPLCADPAADTDCLATFEGQVVDRAGVGQAGVVVRLVDRLTGRPLSSRYVTASDLERDPGYFRLVFPVEHWRATDGWFLRVSPAPHRVEEVGPSPIYTRPAEALTELDGMIRVLSPNVDAMRLTYAGTVEDADGRPLEGASVQFTSTDVTDPTTNITGTYTASVRTDASGAFSVELLGHADSPATYDIVVTPSQSEGSSGVLRVSRVLGSSANGQLFTAPPRARFGGTVQTLTGERMLDARVEARTRGSDRDGALDPAAFLARSNQTSTDANGLFDLRLDVGLYDVVIEPPAGTNFPWRIERDVAIGSSGAPFTSVYELEHPVPVTGVARWRVDDTTQPVVDGEVRAYALVEGSDGSMRALLVARATTDARGAYTLLVPPSP